MGTVTKTRTWDYQKRQSTNSFKVRERRVDLVASERVTDEATNLEYLPADFTCAKDAKDLMAECCKGERIFLPIPSFPIQLTPRSESPEFVLAISSEANEICDKEQKKTMLPEHILNALTVRSSSPRPSSWLSLTASSTQALGFESFVTPVSSVLTEHKELAKGERKKKQSAKKAGGTSGLSEEQLLEQQELLFAASRKRYEEGTVGGAAKPEEA